LARTLRILCDGRTTKVIDDASGEEIENVRSVRFLDGTDGEPRVLIEVLRPSVSLLGQEALPLPIERGELHPEAGTPPCRLCGFAMQAPAMVVKRTTLEQHLYHDECFDLIPPH